MSRLTNLTKAVILVLILAVVGGALWYFGLFDGVTGSKQATSKVIKATSETSTMKPAETSSDVDKREASKNASKNTRTKGVERKKMVISLDEWIGWKSILDANGGLETADGSIFDNLGLDVEIKVMNDAKDSMASLINGQLNGAGYTVNRYAYLQPTFTENNKGVKMVFITNSSTGGDGIIAKSNINSIEDLVGKVVAVPRFSEAQTLIEWLINSSNLTQEQADGIRNSMAFFETPDDAAKAFFSNQVDAACTWEPYLTQAKETTGARVLFDTKAATNLILDGIVFTDEYLENNSEAVELFIQGVLDAAPMYTTEFKYIREFPLFALENDETIAEICTSATLSNFTTNKELLQSTAMTLYEDMANIWRGIGETQVDPAVANKMFDSQYLMTLQGKYVADEKQTPTFTAEVRKQAKQDTKALLTKTLSINFEPNLAIILEDSYAQLQDFAKTASILNGAIIQIEGNIADTGIGDTPEGRSLSGQRAKAVAQYLQTQGIDVSRFVIVGNGITKPVDGLDPRSEAGMKANRRTDMFFKVIE